MANLSEQDDIKFRMDTEVLEITDNTVENSEGHPLFHKVKALDLNWSHGMHYAFP